MNAHIALIHRRKYLYIVEWIQVELGSNTVLDYINQQIRRRSWIVFWYAEHEKIAAVIAQVGHFAFGSTVVMILPPRPGALRVAVGDDVRMGQSLIA